MSRTDQFKEALTDPSLLTIQWAGDKDAGHLKAYDKATKEKIKKLEPVSFTILKERNCIDGYLASKGCGARSNEVVDLRTDEMTINYWVDGKPQLFSKGLYKDIKGEASDAGLKYHRAIYAMVTESSEIEAGVVVKIMLKGAGARSWFKASKEKDMSGVISFGEPTDDQNGAVKFKVPSFDVSKLNPEHSELAEVAFDKVEAYLKSRVPAPQAPAQAPSEAPEGDDEDLPF
jgi:hypothetical protein